MEAGVDDQPSSPPGLRIQHPEAFPLVSEQAHLVGQALAVQAPALDVCATDHPRPQASERVEVRVLHLQGDLEMVARNGLVIRGRGELVVLATGQVVAVRVVDPLARAIRSGRIVIGEGRVLLLVLLDQSDLATGPRQDAEVARRHGHRPLDILSGPCDQSVLGLRRVRDVSLERGSVGSRVVAVAGGVRHLPPLLLDGLELLQAGPMDFLRVEVKGRPAPDRRPVEPLTIGRGPEAGVLAGRGKVLTLERLEEGGVGRVDDVPDDVTDPLAVRFGRDLDHGRHDGRSDRDGQHPLDLGDGPLGDDPRGGQARREPVAEQLGVGRHERGIGVEPGDERLQARRRVCRLELRQLWEELLRATHLVDHAQLVQALVILLDVQFRDDLEHVARDAVLGRQSVGLDRGCLRRRTFHEGPGARPTGWRRILHAVGIAVVAVERGSRRAEFQDRLPEALGEFVDGCLGRIGQGHGGVSCGAAVARLGRGGGAAPGHRVRIVCP